MTLPDKWLKPKRARAGNAKEAWWYGEKNGLYVVIEPIDGTGVSARIPKAMILKWADDIRRRTRA